MPFTLSHPAAVLPVRRFARHSVWSALAIGSMAPDFPYFVGAEEFRRSTHAFGAIGWFCVPVGLAVWLVFQHGLRAPWLHLLPASLASRLRSAPTRAPLAALVASLAIGGATHVLWDSITHEHQPGVVLVEGLNAVTTHWLGFPVRGYPVLQHGSTLLGALALADALRRWLRRTPAGPLPRHWETRRRVRARVWALLALGSTPAALAFAWLRVAPRWQPADLLFFVNVAVVAALSAALAVLCTYAIWWHLRSADAQGTWQGEERVADS
jgi:hypothetical protein